MVVRVGLVNDHESNILVCLIAADNFQSRSVERTQQGQLLRSLSFDFNWIMTFAVGFFPLEKCVTCTRRAYALLLIIHIIHRHRLCHVLPAIVCCTRDASRQQNEKYVCALVTTFIECLSWYSMSNIVYGAQNERQHTQRSKLRWCVTIQRLIKTYFSCAFSCTRSLQ